MARSSHARAANAAVLQARRLRRSMSPPEATLWQVLRRRPDGLKFRRQHPFELYVADFYCAAAKLVVEIDGTSHDLGDNPRRDARRDSWMRDQGLWVIRFAADEVMKDVESVVTAILAVARR
jgi:very-short-patch-repair endonuclease